MKIPQDDKRIIVTNGIDSLQNYISYVKNIDLDERGYFKLASPMLKIYTDEVAEGGDVDFDRPDDLFAYSDGAYKIITGVKIFNLVNIGSLSFAEDSGATGGTDHTRIINWENSSWFINLGDVYEYTGASATTVYTSRISAVLKYIELFVNRNSLVGGSSNNIVKQYDNTYANTVNLTLPDSFIITGIKYSGNYVGIITRGPKNQGNAMFFLWDGETSGANAGYPVNDSYISAVEAYKSSWIIFTTAGQLLYFNGGGFTELGTLPTFRFDDDIISLGPNNSNDPGNVMHVDGDVVYVNCASLPEFSSNFKPYRPGFSGGGYIYDPEIGFYHRYAPSYSLYKAESCAVASNIITSSANHYLKTGDEVWLKATDQGLTGKRVYFAIVLTNTTFKLANSYNDALENTSLTITDGTLANLFWVRRKDYGIESLRFADLGVIKRGRCYEGFDESGVSPVFLGCKLIANDVSAANRVNALCAEVPVMSNIGFIYTSKFQTNDFEDNWKGVVIKYPKLSEQSSITVKAKTKDQEAIIVGDMTLFDETYTGPYITWDASGSYFETTFDLTDVEELDEVHVFAGAGSGQTAHIESISYNSGAGVWQVTLDEELRGISSNAKSCVAIDKYRKIGTITASSRLGYEYCALAEASPTMELKIQLKGVKVKISEILPVKTSHEGNI